MSQLVFFIPELHFIDRLIRKQHAGELFLKLVDNINIFLVVTDCLDVKSVLSLLQVNKKTLKLKNIAKLEVRLLKKSIKTMEQRLNPVVQSISFNFMKTFTLKKTMIPKLPFKVKSEVTWQDHVIKALEQKLSDFQEQEYFGEQKSFKLSDQPYEEWNQQAYQEEMLRKKIANMREGPMIVEREYDEKDFSDKIIDGLEPLIANGKPNSRAKMKQQIKEVINAYRWVRRQIGITFFLNPDF